MNHINYCLVCGEVVVEPNARHCTSCGNALFNEDEMEQTQKDVALDRMQSKRINKKELHYKRNKILNQSKPSNLKRNFIIFLMALIPIGVYVIKNTEKSGNPILSSQPKVAESVDYLGKSVNLSPVDVKLEDGKILIPIQEVIRKKMVSFEYKQNGYRIPLLAYLSPAGKLVTAVSVCEPCNSTRFHIENEDMVCNACGSRWDLNSLLGKSGGCLKYPPDPLPSIIVGNEIQIEESIVKSWTPRV